MIDRAYKYIYIYMEKEYLRSSRDFADDNSPEFSSTRHLRVHLSRVKNSIDELSKIGEAPADSLFVAKEQKEKKRKEKSRLHRWSIFRL